MVVGTSYWMGPMWAAVDPYGPGMEPITDPSYTHLSNQRGPAWKLRTNLARARTAVFVMKTNTGEAHEDGAANQKQQCINDRQSN